MRRTLTLALSLALACLAGLLPAVPAAAYSYGPAVGEPIAEAYTAAMAALNKEPADWSGADAAFAQVRAEVEKDAGGPAAVAAWSAAVEARDQAQAVPIFRAIVLANLERRLNFAQQNLSEFEAAKTLMDRAAVTYDALSPLVQATDAALDTRVRAELDNAAAALGSPGVLGVGQQPAQPERFAAAREAILAALRPLFHFDFAAAAAAPAQPSPEPSPEPAPAPAEDSPPAEGTAGPSTDAAPADPEPAAEPAAGSETVGAPTGDAGTEPPSGAPDRPAGETPSAAPGTGEAEPVAPGSDAPAGDAAAGLRQGRTLVAVSVVAAAAVLLGLWLHRRSRRS